MADSLDAALLARLREVLDNAHVTEAELRTVMERADAWARTLQARLDASERLLAELEVDGDVSVAVLAGELRRVETLRPALAEARSLVDELDSRARELRTTWLLRQVESLRPHA